MSENHSAPYPPPDFHPAWAPPPAPAPHPVVSRSHLDPRGPPAQDTDFLIIGLFALRLARTLIQSLDHYPERIDDIEWVEYFLGPYDVAYDLAKVTGSAKQAYLDTYPRIAGRMKAQRKYPLCFMALNPVTQQREEALNGRGGLTDVQRLEIINFADAAREWGSTVHVPEREAKRMLELADQRRVADLTKRPDVEVGPPAASHVHVNNSPFDFGRG
ncbi:hypothetical protein C7974DRAFT_455144 [Boeremia exigua]|uniref:uncharacterized protein n=1 Tax=Boeremia exigua TaxID=749465 RepID=UPI001E8DE285|nr:uncharacterized protein C7974DRAFT_455144 [Boeremia exigua]KAH6625227.1 hypothetical protein C7974DRAFT_455144 [Boeremia exigua]